jgi:hypothetical protein
MNAPLQSLIVCILSLTSVSAWASDPCSLQKTLQGLFKVEAKQGDRIVTDKIFNQLPYSKLDYTADLLGHGAGGDVYRITPRHFPKRTFIVKVTDLDTALNDSIGFELIQKAAGLQSEVKIASHKILPLKNVPENSMFVSTVMQMQDIGGRSLFSMFADPQVPKAVKQVLEQKYKSFLRRLEDGLDDLYDLKAIRVPSTSEFYQAEKEWNHLGKAAIEAQPEIVMWDISVHKLFDPLTGDPALAKKLRTVAGNRSSVWFEVDKDIQMIIKSDNIIVTKDYDLYLIDPH